MLRMLATKKFWFTKFSGFLVSPTELFVFCLVFFMSLKFGLSNLRESRLQGHDLAASRSYDVLKSALYNEMSSPNPQKKYLIKNVLGPAPLPNPLSDIMLDKGVRLNYLIRVSQPARIGRARDQLRFEVSHDDGRNVYRYTEIQGEILEQVIRKTVIDE
jgi:hypothetical protein